MNFNQNQDFNQQFNYNQADQFNYNQNTQNMQIPITNQQNQQFPQYQQNQQQQQFQQNPIIPSPQPYGQQQQQIVFNPVQVDFNNNMIYQQQQQQQLPTMQQPQMPNQNLQQALIQLQGQMVNIFQTPKLIDPNATEAELQNELSLLQDNVQNIQKANLIADIKNYLLKQNYKKEIPKNVNYCIRALGIMKGSNCEIILKELKKKFEEDTDCLFSEEGTCFLGLTVCCCLCFFMLCLLLSFQKCGKCLPSNFKQIQEIRQLIDQNIAQFNQIQQI